MANGTTDSRMHRGIVANVRPSGEFAGAKPKILNQRLRS
jgi:hypothetical protein